ncbi:hypothetical protein [Sphingobacterium sp.]|uniref:hypothetical protein n=1 Tax=Sphingobacterium sp. TaxID=341027 RepID=UPI00289C093D|nr:hypothetical protein [Sphingobacterium sp.]
MITGIVNSKSRTLEIRYPEFSKVKSTIMSVRSFDEANAILRIRTLKFLVAEIRSFVKMRNYAYVNSNTLNKERTKAIKHLRFVLESYSEGSIERFARHIAGSLVSFAALAPSKPSNALTHFDNHIIPIIKYCQELSSEGLDGKTVSGS